MTKEEYLQKQQELRDRRCEANQRHRAVIDSIELKHRENCRNEDERYRIAKRQEKDIYDRTWQDIEQEQMALKAEWYEQHPECPMKESYPRPENA